MTTQSIQSAAVVPVSRSVINGVLGGIVGGAAFGLMMQAQGMMPMVAQLANSDSVVVGWIVHLLISAVIGAVFGVVISRFQLSWATAAAAGAVNGIIWWVLGALILMPVMLGMSDMVLRVEQMQINSLIGHLIFGVIAALVYKLMMQRA